MLLDQKCSIFTCLSVMSSSPRRQFIYVGLSMSWMEAQSYCRDQYVDLVTLNDMGDVELLKVYTKSTSDTWIGLKRAPQLSWGWSAGENTLLDYSAWDEGEPGNSSLPNRLCGAMCFGSWSSLNCSTPLNFCMFVSVCSWPDAQVFCRNSYTDLATIGSPLEQTQVSSLLTTADTVWVGLFADSWVWSDEGSSSFRYWKTDNMQSLSDTSDCAVMDLSLFGTWTNLSCNKKKKKNYLNN
uniref:C-type lectin domain-containing protein n=1 Tax=Electrophorus electricus TaxID=8005 RepID=A0A4W4EEZ8_ELEEL